MKSCNLSPITSTSGDFCKNRVLRALETNDASFIGNFGSTYDDRCIDYIIRYKNHIVRNEDYGQLPVWN